MPRSEPLLFDAYCRAMGEDRVTEVLATVLSQSPRFLQQLAHLAKLKPEAPYEYESRRRYASGRAASPILSSTV